MDFPIYAKNKLDKLITHYSQKFTFEYNKETAGCQVPVIASMHNRQPVSIIGVATKAMGPEASEYIFFLTEESFDADIMAKLEKILTEAESEYVSPGRDHAFTFLSAVVLARDAERGTLNTLKKYKLRKDYHPNGWVVSRIVVMTEDGSIYSNNDGSDLRRMLQKIVTHQ